jgi:hypothetical protein
MPPMPFMAPTARIIFDHLLHLLKLIQQTVDFLNRDACACRNPPFSARL